MEEVIKLLAPYVVSFLLTSLLANRLVQKWQQRNWMQQQKLLRVAKELEEIDEVIKELMRLGDARCYRSRRLMLTIAAAHHKSSSDTRDRVLSSRMDEYAATVVNWNDRFNSLCGRVVMHTSNYYARRLELQIQPSFVQVSQKIESMIDGMSQPISIDYNAKTAQDIDVELNSISGKLGLLGKSLIKVMQKRRNEAYNGKEIPFERDTAELFSNWYLIKQLFKTKHPPLTILRTTANFDPPLVGRD